MSTTPAADAPVDLTASLPADLAANAGLEAFPPPAADAVEAALAPPPPNQHDPDYPRTCRVADCENRTDCWGLCARHRMRLAKRGRLDLVPAPDRRGENNPRAVLTEGDVRAMLWRRRHQRTSLERLASDYGVSVTQVKDIVRGAQWAHVRESLLGELAPLARQDT